MDEGEQEQAPLPLSEQRSYVSSSSVAELKPSNTEGDARPSKPSAILGVAAAGALLGSSFQFGYNNSVINTTGGLVKDWINSTLVHSKNSSTGSDVAASADTITLIFSIVVSIWAIGGLIGSLSAGFFADRFGRRSAMMFNNVVAVVGAVLMGIAKPSKSYVPLIIGRFVSGLNCGANTVFSPMFLAEIAPSHLRGSLGVMHQLVVVTGILLSQVVGLPSLFGTQPLWPWALIMTAFPAVLQPIFFLFSPESPRYLLVNRGDSAAATSSLRRLRQDGPDAEDAIRLELSQMEEEAEKERSAPRYGIKGIVSSPILRQPFAIAIVLHLAQQLSGINGIFYYSTKLFESFGLSEIEAVYASIGTSGILVVATLISVPLMEKAGRRTLMLLGLGLIVVFEIVLTIGLNIFEAGGDGASASRYVGVVAVVLTVAAFAIGPGSIPWFFPAEIFPTGARGSAMSFGCGVNWLANFVVGVSFEHLQKAVGSLCFVPFIVLSACFWIFSVIKMPETKNKSFAEINAIFERRIGASVNR